MDQKWNKYTYVCPMCDALIEYTLNLSNIPPDLDVTELTCVCGAESILLSVADATILPITKQKEEPEMLATPTYLEEQVNELKSQMANHQNCDYWKAEHGRIGRQLIELVNDGFENDYEAKDILNSVCEIIDYNPVKTIEFTATMRFTGSIEVPMDEAEDFDLTEILNDAYVDINNGNVVVDNYELYDAEEC